MGLISRVSSRTYRRTNIMAGVNKLGRDKPQIQSPLQDPEVAKVFNEYRQMMNFTEAKKMEFNSLIQQQQRNAKHDELVNKELDELDNERKYYFSVGRMFMCQPKAQIQKTLTERQKTYHQIINEKKTERDAIMKACDSKKSELEEMMRRKTN